MTIYGLAQPFRCNHVVQRSGQVVGVGSADLHVLAATTPTPGLPLITAPGQDTDALYRAVAAAIEALSPKIRDTLHLKGLVRIPASAYLAMPTPPPPAA